MKSAPRLSVIIPAYNEERTLARLLKQVASQLTLLPAHLERELIIVNDGSTDATGRLLEQFHADFQPPNNAPRVTATRIITHNHNQGLAAAMRTAFKHAAGDFLLIQHSDLEYPPAGWPALLAPLLAGRADLVAGSRYLTADNPSFKRSYRLAGQFITSLVNVLYGAGLTDVITAAHAMRREVADSITFTGEGFAFESELTCRALRGGWRLTEVPTTFHPRSFAEGKKIRAYHIVGIIKIILQVRLAAHPAGRPAAR